MNLLKLITAGWWNNLIIKEYIKLSKALSKKPLIKLPKKTILLNGLKTSMVNYIGDDYDLDREERASMFLSNDWRFDVKSNTTEKSFNYSFVRMESKLKG